MRSRLPDSLPLPVRCSMRKFGADIVLARKRRHLTVAMMVDRLGVAKSTYLRAEKGDTTVSVGVYAMALFVLGLDTPFAGIADTSVDEAGQLQDIERLPKRVRLPKNPRPQ